MSLHRVREGFKEERVACINRIRGVLAEFGLVFGKSPKVLRSALADVLEDADNELSARARLVLQRAFEHWRELDARIALVRPAGRLARAQQPSRAQGDAAKVTGIGELGASALVAAWASSSSSRQRQAVRRVPGPGAEPELQRRQGQPGRITKRGDDYLRTLLIQGAKSAVMSADKRDDPTSRWLVQLTARVGWQKACVAMANKNARILWAVMTRESRSIPDTSASSLRPSSRRTGACCRRSPPSAPPVPAWPECPLLSAIRSTPTPSTFSPPMDVLSKMR
jgi:transposase